MLAFLNTVDQNKALHRGSRGLAKCRTLQLLPELLRVGQLGVALDTLRAYLIRDPQDPDVLYNYAVLLGEVGMADKASQIYRQCLKSNPNHLDCLWNAGELFRLNFCFDIAYDYLSKFERLGEYRAGLYHRIAVCLWHLGNLQDAKNYFERALIQDPHPLTNWEYSLFLMSQKDYLNGFTYYKDRFLVGERINVIYSGLGFPIWDGNFSELKDRTLFLIPEQGLGDQVQFLACLPSFFDAIPSSSTEVILLVGSELYELVKNSFIDLPAKVYLYEPGQDSPFRSSEFPRGLEFPIGDLPWALHLSKPNPKTYLQASKNSIAQARQWLADCHSADKKINIGIAWSTNDISPSLARNARNIPIRHYLEFLNIPQEILGNINFISLAVGNAAGEVYKLYDLDVLDFSHLIDDFSDTAGLIHCCDYVISPCTSLAHVAGAMGKPVLLMLSKYGDWRWGNQQSRSDWYLNVRIFQQLDVDDWSVVMKDVIDSLIHDIKSRAQC